MPYDDGEKLIERQFHKMESFTEQNVARSDWLILNTGHSPDGVYVILRPGGFEASQLGLGGAYEVEWTTVAEMWVAYLDDPQETASLLTKMRWEVMSYFMANRLAGDDDADVDIRDAFVPRGDPVEEMWDSGGNQAFYLKQDLNIVWAEEIDVTLTE